MIARIFIADGTVADCALNEVTWDQFIHQLILNNAVITADTWINRQGITKILKIEAPDGFEAPNVLKIVPPQGTA